jgi:hypothetical protein
VPVVSCDYLVNRLFEERHGPLMWLVPIRPEAERLATREYSAPVMGKRWSELVTRSFAHFFG